jgi:enamine deaminase RidA (YjgF/YER057c/UK114 family)
VSKGERYAFFNGGGDVENAIACATALRRFAGPLAEELAMLCRPEGQKPDAVCQAETAYRALATLLTSHQASFSHLVSETLFLRDIRHDLPLVLGVRTQVLADIGESARAPLPAFIEQAPVDQNASFELSAAAAVPRRREAWSLRDVQASPSCACEGCARTGARLVRLGDRTFLWTTNVYGAGGDAFEQAGDMFGAAERLLDQCGMNFRDVVRTWIHLRDIDRDYEALNKARREFFRHRGIERRPASTGVQGIPFPDAHDFSMTLHAVKSARPLDVTPMSTPSLNEAWSYGVDFSRGLKLVDANKVTLHVSGTASIDEAGQTVHAGNFAAQVDRMLNNIASLLAEEGATFENLISAVTYLKNPSDAPILRSIYNQRGFNGFPCALVQASLCRPELLCETEAVAMLPLAATGE